MEHSDNQKDQLREHLLMAHFRTMRRLQDLDNDIDREVQLLRALKKTSTMYVSTVDKIYQLKLVRNGVEQHKIALEDKLSEKRQGNGNDGVRSAPSST